jgi:hypothetical protein
MKGEGSLLRARRREYRSHRFINCSHELLLWIRAIKLDVSEPFRSHPLQGERAVLKI